VPFALGTDTMGSVRIPAACCGLFGWKPSLGAVSTQGTVPLSERLDTVGFLAASARDLALLADVVLDPSGNRSQSVAQRPVRIRRLDVVTGFGAVIDDAAGAAVQQVLDVLGTLPDTDADAAAAAIAIDPALVRRRGLLVCEADAAEAWATELAAQDPGLSPALTSLLIYGRDADPGRVQAARDTCDEVAAQVINMMNDGKTDVLVLPTIPGPPPLIDADPPGLADLTAWVNLAGLPAVSLPTRVHVAGEPVPRSVQLVGRRGNDLALLALVAAVEAELVG
jgi:aspartyl-tRNA(Asn)/glutamyl-tRNA(Gln) amidotransferase subunit A